MDKRDDGLMLILDSSSLLHTFRVCFFKSLFCYSISAHCLFLVLILNMLSVKHEVGKLEKKISFLEYQLFVITVYVSFIKSHILSF